MDSAEVKAWLLLISGGVWLALYLRQEVRSGREKGPDWDRDLFN